jgi:hypothetical protein
MRFMQFRAHDKYALHLSKMEKVLGISSQLLRADEGADRVLALVTLLISISLSRSYFSALYKHFLSSEHDNSSLTEILKSTGSEVIF